MHIAAIKLRILTHNLSRGPLRLLTLLSTQEMPKQSESLWARLLNAQPLQTGAVGASHRTCLTEQCSMGRNKVPHVEAKVQREFSIMTNDCQSFIHTLRGYSSKGLFSDMADQWEREERVPRKGGTSNTFSFCSCKLFSGERSDTIASLSDV